MPGPSDRAWCGQVGKGLGSERAQEPGPRLLVLWKRVGLVVTERNLVRVFEY